MTKKKLLKTFFQNPEAVKASGKYKVKKFEYREEDLPVTVYQLFHGDQVVAVKEVILGPNNELREYHLLLYRRRWYQGEEVKKFLE